MNISQLEQELKEKLPPEHIYVDIEREVASYYDYHGVTFRDDESEQKIADSYIERTVSERVGFPVRITRWSDGNGHCELRYERMQEK